MADFPKSRVEAFDRAEQCGIPTNRADGLYLKVDGAGSDLEKKKVQCFNEGPGSLSLVARVREQIGNLTDKFKESVAGAKEDAKLVIGAASVDAANTVTMGGVDTLRAGMQKHGMTPSR